MKPHQRHKFERFKAPLNRIERRYVLISRLQAWAILDDKLGAIDHYTNLLATQFYYNGTVRDLILGLGKEDS